MKSLNQQQTKFNNMQTSTWENTIEQHSQPYFGYLLVNLELKSHYIASMSMLHIAVANRLKE